MRKSIMAWVRKVNCMCNMHKNIMEFANKVNGNLTTDSIINTCVGTFRHRLERLTGCMTADSLYVTCVRRLWHGLETGCLQRVCNTRKNIKAKVKRWVLYEGPIAPKRLYLPNGDQPEKLGMCQAQKDYPADLNSFEIIDSVFCV